MRDPALARVRVELHGRVYAPKQALPVTMRALREDYGPQPDATMSLSLRRDDIADAPVLWKKQWTTGQEGELHVQVPGQRPGAYRLQVTAQSGDGQQLGQDEAVFVVRAQSLERSETALRPKLLKAIAQTSGGDILDDLNGLTQLDLSRGEQVRIAHAQRVSLWNNMILLMIFAFIDGAEWWLRRRMGYS